MKRLKISHKEAIRQDGEYYCLTDLFRLTNLNGVKSAPWTWSIEEGLNYRVSRRGWIFRKCWGRQDMLIRYARYLTPGLYNDVIRALNLDDAQKLIDVLGQSTAVELDYRCRNLVEERKAAVRRLEAEEARRKEQVIAARMADSRKVSPPVDVSAIPRFSIDDLSKDLRNPPPRSAQGVSKSSARTRPVDRSRSSGPTRSLSYGRSGGQYVSHRSEPDYVTQVLATQMALDNWDDSSHRDDSCHTPSYSSHDSHHSSSSWGGDSGGSYDSGGGGGGCD